MMSPQKAACLFLCAALLSSALLGCQRSPVRESSAPPVQLTSEPLEVVADPPPKDGAGGRSDPEAAGSGNVGALEVLLSACSTKVFSTQSVAPEDLEQVLLSGARAPSARNIQPWHFTVVSGKEKLPGAISAATEGTVGIIISGQAGEQEGANISFDCGLATQNMVIAAHSLGLGAHIYLSGVSEVNSNAAAMGIPDGYEAIMILLIGYPEDPADTAAAASARNPLEDTVTYLE